MDTYSTKRSGGAALGRSAWFWILGLALLAVGGQAGAGLRGGLFCLPGDASWEGRLTGCQPGIAWLREVDGSVPGAGGTDFLFHRPGFDPRLLRMGPWEDMSTAAETGSSQAAPAPEAGLPYNGGFSQAASPPGTEDWLSIQLVGEGFYFFLGDLHDAPEEMISTGADGEELPSGIGLQKRWHF